MGVLDWRMVSEQEVVCELLVFLDTDRRIAPFKNLVDTNGEYVLKVSLIDFRWQTVAIWFKLLRTRSYGTA